MMLKLLTKQYEWKSLCSVLGCDVLSPFLSTYYFYTVLV